MLSDTARSSDDKELYGEGFRLPTAMVFTTSASAPAQLPDGIVTTSDAVKSFVSFAWTGQQGRRAGLSDATTSMISNQLMVQITYDPLECKAVTVSPTRQAMNIIMANWLKRSGMVVEQSRSNTGIGTICRALLLAVGVIG
ncbi:hypothetical protein KIN20_023557 [Parelaphostrongylus tenuis]|uniref:Uncharacterized protein n=1 Tax=Parelaphostrongylus tenuis TaxID=148309 RepID=A0AAD5QW64_PARTN|nr:hypothetical protein KIN20_023557 [Parelaphostrongylus tenuis]